MRSAIAGSGRSRMLLRHPFTGRRPGPPGGRCRARLPSRGRISRQHILAVATQAAPAARNAAARPGHLYVTRLHNGATVRASLPAA